MVLEDVALSLNLLRPVQTKPTSCNIVGPTMLHDIRQKFLNSSQHRPTWCLNKANMLHPTMLGDVEPTCCLRLNGPDGYFGPIICQA